MNILIIINNNIRKIKILKSKYNKNKPLYIPYVPPEKKCPEHEKDILDCFCVDEKDKYKVYNTITI